MHSGYGFGVKSPLNCSESGNPQPSILKAGVLIAYRREKGPVELLRAHEFCFQVRVAAT